MKKLFVAMLAVLAVVLSGCKLNPYRFMIVNDYSKNAIVLLSDNEDCRSTETAKDVTVAEPHKVYGGNFDLKGLYAIVFVCETEVKDGEKTLQGYKYKGTINLNEYAGYSVVTVKIDEHGMPGVEADKL